MRFRLDYENNVRGLNRRAPVREEGSIPITAVYRCLEASMIRRKKQAPLSTL